MDLGQNKKFFYVLKIGISEMNPLLEWLVHFINSSLKTDL